MAKAGPMAERWRERVLAQRASGQTVRGWCRANGCPEHGFYWWRANLGLSSAPAGGRRRASGPSAATVTFARVVAVDPPAPAAHAEPLRLTLVGGRELALPASMPVGQVARLIRAIEGEPSAIEGEPSTVEADDAGAA